MLNSSRMQVNSNIFVAIFVLMCGFSVIVREKSSERTLARGIFFGTTVIFALVFTPAPAFFMIFIGICALATRPVTIFAHNFRRKRREAAELSAVLTRLILNLKLGRGLRESLHRELRQFHVPQVEMLLFNLECDENLPILNKKWAEFGQLVKKLDRNPAKIICQLERLREKNQVEAYYRKRLAQILSQPKLQAFIAVGLYFVLLGFVMFSFPREHYLKFVFASLPLLAAGVAWLLNMGKQFRWKV